MKACLDASPLAQREGYRARTFTVEGELPIMLLGLLGPDCRFTYEYVVWWTSKGWQVQYLTPQFLPCAYSLVAVPGPSAGARQISSSGGVRLAVVGAAPCCGSAPGASLALFQLDADGWRVLWDGVGSEMPRLSHRKVEFVGERIDVIHVRGSSWFYPDERRDIFHESNPGPHRYFEETWTLQGDGYVLLDHRVQPSAYNTLVEFIYRLSTADESGAVARLTDSALLDKAKELGLVQNPLGQEWLTNLGPETECCGPIHIISGAPRQVVVEFVQQRGDWLISGIRPESYPYP